MSVEIHGAESIYKVMTSIGQGARPRMLVTMRKIGMRMSAYVKERKLSGDPIHRRTGRLRRSIHSVSSYTAASVSSSTGTNVKYAKYLEFGTNPHVILPVRAKMLSWMQDGRRVFARKVNHPGNPAFRFLRGSLEEMQPENMTAIRASMLELVKGSQA